MPSQSAFKLETLPMGEKEEDLLRRIDGLERELAASREKASRLENLFENSPDILYYINSEGNFIPLNDGTVDVLGYPNDDLRLEKYVAKVVHPEDREKVIKSFYDCVAAQTPFVKGLTFRIVKNSGEVMWAELYSRMNYDENGKFLEEVGILRDVSERRKMEERLISLNRNLERANEELQAAYRWLRESNDYLKAYRYEEDIGFLVDSDGLVEWCSEKVISFTKKTRTALIGSCLTELLAEDSIEALKKGLRQAAKGITELFPVRLKGQGENTAIMDVKVTRLTSHQAKRLWVLFQKPIQS